MNIIYVPNSCFGKLEIRGKKPDRNPSLHGAKHNTKMGNVLDDNKCHEEKERKGASYC